MVKSASLQQDFAQLARIALTGRAQDVQLLLHRYVKRYRTAEAGLAEELSGLLREAPTRASPLRRQSEVPVPVDTDTRLQLLRVEDPPVLDHEPVFSPQVSRPIRQVVEERAKLGELTAAGLHPTRSVLFTGLPGVGKTMCARWVAIQLNRPLLTLDLAAVMSSFLGRTGSNLRHVLDYAKSTDCVLLLDELDAVAKRRDDGGEVGELKRLVTVLIQEIDDWPASGLLLAATNHPELLDPAIWRRFDAVVEFPLPNHAAIREFAASQLVGHVEDPGAWADLMAIRFDGQSFADVERRLTTARRAAVLAGKQLDLELLAMFNGEALSKSNKIDLAVALVNRGVATQRRAHELTGVARETIRAHAKVAGDAG